MSEGNWRPAFIVGPGRSGSTLLYKLLCLHRDVGFISNYDEKFMRFPFVSKIADDFLCSPKARAYAWFDHGGGAYYLNRSFYKKVVPTPVEGERLFRECSLDMGRAMASDASISGDIRDLLSRLQRQKNKRVIVVKRTALNKSIPLLHRTFPDARFVYLIRDGRSVVNSLLKVYWWPETPLPWADWQTPSELEKNGMDKVSIASKTWLAGVEYAEFGLSNVPADRVFKIRYEDLLDNPHEWISSLMKFLGVEDVREYMDTFRMMNISNKHGGWTNKFSPDELNVMEHIQGEKLIEYGYM